MFTGNFKEKTATNVPIKGVSKLAFDKFLSFVYTKEFDSWEGCELELLELSERYQVSLDVCYSFCSSSANRFLQFIYWMWLVWDLTDFSFVHFFFLYAFSIK